MQVWNSFLHCFFKGDFVRMNFISSNRYVRFLQLAVVGLILWLGLAVFQPVVASSTVTVQCGSFDNTETVAIGKEATCLVDGGEGGTPSFTIDGDYVEEGETSPSDTYAYVHCGNAAQIFHSVEMEAGTTVQCILDW